MDAKDIKKRTTDEVIAYLLKSKKEMQDEIKKDVHSKEFQEALQKLRAKQKNV